MVKVRRSDGPILIVKYFPFVLQSLDLYGGDQANATWSVRHFANFLKRLMTSYRLNKVHTFAHSMGSQVAINGLLRLTGWNFPKGAARPGQLVLAAPDFNTGEFFEAQADLDKLVRK
jgi:esterase/lipase superfamily enzyme